MAPASEGARAARMNGFFGCKASQTESLPPETIHSPQASSASKPLRLGLIADVQYADVDDSFDFSGRHKRHYRNTMNVLDEAVEVWNSRDVSAVVQLGDLIDGCNARQGRSCEALGAVMSTLGRCPAPRYDLVGNHELYNFRRSALSSSGLRCSGSCASDCAAYSSAPLGEHWQLVFLDSYEHALIGVPEDHPSFVQAVEVIRKHNEQALHSNDWAAVAPPGKAHFTPLNGGLSASQLAWLRTTLSSAQQSRRHVLVFAHVPLYQPASGPKTVAWNGDEVLAVLHEFQDIVVAVFAGHDHCGGYAVDVAGVHHVTMCSPLHVAPPDRECFGVLECYESWAHLTCYGYACAESGMEWQGRRYPELTLAKGADNRPE